MIARCGLGYCPRTERKIPSVPSIFFHNPNEAEIRKKPLPEPRTTEERPRRRE